MSVVIGLVEREMRPSEREAAARILQRVLAVLVDDREKFVVPVSFLVEERLTEDLTDVFLGFLRIFADAALYEEYYKILFSPFPLTEPQPVEETSLENLPKLLGVFDGADAVGAVLAERKQLDIFQMPSFFLWKQSDNIAHFFSPELLK